MRWLLLLLVFLNVLYWFVHLDNPEGRAAPATPQLQVPAIQLLSEVGMTSLAAPTFSLVPNGNIQRCYTVGPFSSVAEAQRIATALQNAGAEGSAVRDAQSGDPSEYWVYLPPHPSRNDAVTVALGLANRGFRDYFIVRDGDRRNAISLGVFSTIERAQERQRQIRALGQDALIEVRPKGKPKFSVEYRSRADMEPRIEKLGYGNAVVRRYEVECPAP